MVDPPFRQTTGMAESGVLVTRVWHSGGRGITYEFPCDALLGELNNSNPLDPITYHDGLSFDILKTSILVK